MSEPGQWYLKRENATSGPFPHATIESQVALGRIRPADELSNDGETWRSVESICEFSAYINFDRSSREFVKFDERATERRSGPSMADADRPGTARSSDRRRSEAPSVVRSREKSNEIWQSLRVVRDPAVALWLGVAAIVVSLFAIAPYQAVEVRSTYNCDSSPSVGVNWEFCDFKSVDLRRLDLREANLANAKFESSNLAGALMSNADLAYANLSNANLHLTNFTRARFVGAKLVGANLSYANFTGADLKYSDLTNARIDGTEFSGAELGGAIWLNGIRCARGSIGRCVEESSRK